MFGLVSAVSWADVVTAVANGIIAIGIVFAGAGWMAERRKRAGEAVSSLGHEWDGDTFLRKAREALDHKSFVPDVLALEALTAFRNVNPVEWFEVYEPLLNFFEDLGALEQSKAIRLGVIDSALGTSVRRSWTRWEVAVDQLRAYNHQPTMYANFECLAMRLKKRDLRRIQRLHWAWARMKKRFRGRFSLLAHSMASEKAKWPLRSTARELKKVAKWWHERTHHP